MVATKLDVKNSVIFVMVALVVVAAIVVLTVTSGTGATVAAGGETLRIGVTPNSYYLPIFVAVNRSFFRKEGFSPQVVFMRSTNDNVNALVEGEVDITGLASSGILSVEARSPDTLVLLQTQNLGSYVMLSRGSDNYTLKDLEGKRIGTWNSPTSSTYLSFIFANASRKPNIESMDMTLLNQALNTSLVDAIFTTGNYAGVGRALFGFRTVSNNPVVEKTFPHFFNGGTVTTAELARNNPEKARRIMRALDKAVSFINGNNTEARSIMANALNISDDGIARTTPLDEYVPIGELKRSDVERVEQALLGAGALPRAVNVTTLLELIGKG